METSPYFSNAFQTSWLESLVPTWTILYESVTTSSKKTQLRLSQAFSIQSQSIPHQWRSQDWKFPSHQMYTRLARLRLLADYNCYASLWSLPHTLCDLCSAYDHSRTINMWRFHTIPLLSHASRTSYSSIIPGRYVSIVTRSLSLLPPPVWWQCHESRSCCLSELPLLRKGHLDYTCWIIT